MHARERRQPAAPESGASFNVRRATLADLSTVIELRLALLREHHGNPMYQRVRPDARERARALFASQLESSSEITLLAERDGAVVGILRCIDAVGSPLLEPSRYGYVASAYVRPDERRAGILTTLCARAEDWCRTRGLVEVRLHSTPENGIANATWESLGFRIVEQLRLKALEP